MRKHGIIPEKDPDPEPVIQEALLEARRRAHENRLEDKNLDELHDLEDEEDASFLEKYRQQRLAELSNLQKKSVHGQVYPLQKPEYARDVTEASTKTFVFVHLTSSLGNNVESRVLSDLWRQLAQKYPDLKFCEMRGDLCIEGYPERNTPTILMYKDGDIKKQIVTLGEMNGPRTSVMDLERMLSELGAVQENDMRLERRGNGESLEQGKARKGGIADAEDDDWN